MKLSSKKQDLYGKVIDKIFNLIYSKDKIYERILILLTIFGFLLRIFSAINLDVLADDMVYASQSAGIIGSGMISTHSNPPLFFYLTDLAYHIFGYTTFASRFLPLIAGTLLIPLSFLISRKFLGSKPAIFVAFFVTFSNFLTRMVFTEQSLVVLFFSFFGVYLGINYLEKGKKIFILSSGCMFGLALLTKYNAPFFILSFLVFSVVSERINHKKIITSEKLKHAFYFVCILLLFAAPFLTFNYSLYQEKGILDVYFSRIIHIEKAQEVYSSLAGQERSFFDNVTELSNYGNYNLVYKTDILLFFLSIPGLFYLIKNKKFQVLSFFIIFLIIPFVLQSAGAPLQKHFAFMIFLFAIPAGYFLSVVSDRLTSKKALFTILLLILILFMLLNLGKQYGTPASYHLKSPTSQLDSFLNNEAENSDLLVFDNRIYTSRVFWLATPNNFATLDQFVQIYDFEKSIQNKKVPTRVLLIECLSDDCGWGWISQNPSVNLTAEKILTELKTIAVKKEIIYGYAFSGNEILKEKSKNPIYEVSSFTIPLTPEVIQRVRNTQSFYFTPYLYENKEINFFDYSVSGIEKLTYNFSLFLIYLSILLTALSFLLIIWLIL